MTNHATPVDVVTTRAGPGAETPGTTATSVMPATVGRYRVERELGRGGMGTVYLGYDPQLDRHVAIKLLHRAAGSQQRLLREARAVAKIRHAHVVGVYDVGECTHSDGAMSVFMVMEYVEGVPMPEWLDGVRGQPEVIVAAFLQAGRGLQAAHARGIIHRDFKPLNVLIDRDGAAKVLDFGLARAATEDGDDLETSESSMLLEGLPLDATLTEVGSVLGTPRYMSPEQHRGRELDARSDQYSFCLALFLALGGRYPFPTDSAKAMVAAKVRGDVSTEGLGLSRGASEALARGLRGAPSSRWPSMAELLRRLRPQRRKWPLVLAATIAVVGTPLSFSQHAAAPSDPCVAHENFVADVWGAAPKQEVQAALATSSSGVAATATVLAQLDQRAAALTEARVAMCEAQLTERDAQPRIACLDGLKDEFSGVVQSVRAAEHHEFLLDLLALLGHWEACDPTAAGEVLRAPAALRERLFELRVLIVEHEYAAALPVYDRLLADARDAAAKTVLAEVLVAGATLHSRRRDLPPQLEAASEALRLAEAAGRDDLAVSALLIRAAALKDGAPEQVEEARRDLDLAAAKLPRVGDGRGDLRARVRYVDASLCQREHFEGHATALSCVQRAEAAVEAASEAPFSSRVQASTMAANAYLMAGSPADANAALASAIDTATAAVGADHPSLTVPIRLRGRIAARQGDAQRAEADFATALALVEAFEGAEAARASPIHLERAQLRVQTGRFAGAIEDYGQVAKFGQPQYRLRAAESIAFATFLAGDFEAALRSVDETLALEQAAPKRNARLRAESLSMRAELLLRLGRVVEALDVARDSVSALAATAHARSAVVVQAKAVLARALGANGDAEGALRVLREAVELSEALVPAAPPGLLLRLRLERAIVQRDAHALEVVRDAFRPDPAAGHFVRDADRLIAEIRTGPG